MNFLKNKYKSYEEGLKAYLEWKESYLEPNDEVSERDIKNWTAAFKALWEKEDLQEAWD